MRLTDRDKHQGRQDPRSSQGKGHMPNASAPPHDMASEVIEHAILSTVAYRDVFDFAVTADEIHRYLHKVSCSRDAVIDTLHTSDLCHGRLESDETYYCLAGRGDILAERHRREAAFARHLARARRVARLIANAPHIRMVALSGSLAARNAYDGSDMDFFCITDQGKMWRVRSLLKSVEALDKRSFKTGMCMNYFLSSAAMTLEDQRLYTAQELAQTLPMYGLETYHAFRAANRWSDSYLPNASGPPTMEEPTQVRSSALIKTPLQLISGSPLGNWLERFESHRKMRRFNADGHYAENHSKFTAESVGHKLHVGDKIEAKWRARLEKALEC